MSQCVAYRFDRHALLQKMSRQGMTQPVTAASFQLQPAQPDSLSQHIVKSVTTERTNRSHEFEEQISMFTLRARLPHIPDQDIGGFIRQRQVGGPSRFCLEYSHCPCPPVDVFQRQPGYFALSKSVSGS